MEQSVDNGEPSSSEIAETVAQLHNWFWELAEDIMKFAPPLQEQIAHDRRAPKRKVYMGAKPYTLEFLVYTPESKCYSPSITATWTADENDQLPADYHHEYISVKRFNRPLVCRPQEAESQIEGLVETMDGLTRALAVYERGVPIV